MMIQVVSFHPKIYAQADIFILTISGLFFNFFEHNFIFSPKSHKSNRYLVTFTYKNIMCSKVPSSKKIRKIHLYVLTFIRRSNKKQEFQPTGNKASEQASEHPYSGSKPSNHCNCMYSSKQ